MQPYPYHPLLPYYTPHLYRAPAFPFHLSSLTVTTTYPSLSITSNPLPSSHPFLTREVVCDGVGEQLLHGQEVVRLVTVLQQLGGVVRRRHLVQQRVVAVVVIFGMVWLRLWAAARHLHALPRLVADRAVEGRRGDTCGTRGLQ